MGEVILTDRLPNFITTADFVMPELAVAKKKLRRRLKFKADVKPSIKK
jgi:hypothetical protein